MKKFLNKITISIAAVVAVAVIAFVATRVNAGVKTGNSITVPAGGQDIANRGTESNPFVILEVVPTVGTDDITWTSGTNYHANFDELQAMRWGLASEVSSILTNTDLLHNLTACEALRDAGLVYLGEKKTVTVDASNKYAIENASKRVVTPTGNYTAKYLVKATASDSGDKYCFVQTNLQKNGETFYGYSQKVNNGSGNCKHVKSGNTDYMVYVGTGGDYNLWTANGTITDLSSFKLVKKTNDNYLKNITNGLYKITEVTSNNSNFDSDAEQTIVFGDITSNSITLSGNYKMHEVAGKNKYAIGTNPVAETVTTYVYEETYYESLTSTNKFITEVIKNAYNISNENLENYKVELITVSASDLNNNTGLIDRADLIVIEGNSSNMGGYAANDISWATAKKLYSKATGYQNGTNKKSPVVMNISVLTPGNARNAGNDNFNRKTNNDRVYINNPTYSNNMYKLANMMGSMGYTALSHYYLSNGTRTPYLNYTDGTMYYTTGYNQNKSLSSWNSDTFAPYESVDGSNRDTLRASMNSSGTGWRSATNKAIVEKEYYLFTGTDSSTNAKKFLFSNSTRHTSDGHYVVTDLNSSLNLNGAGATPLQVIQYLLMNRASENGASPTPTAAGAIDANAVADRAPRILEVQPYIAYDSNDTWIARLKNIYGKTYTASELNIKKMSMSEFIVNTDDLIAQYDMIYIGSNLGGDNGYYKKVVQSLINSDPAFSSNKGLIYMHIGPRWSIGYNHSYGLSDKTNQGLSAGSGSYYTQMSGNDITMIRANTVDEFARNGGIVVIASNLTNYSGTVADSSKVDSSSNLYDLLNKMLASGYTGNVVALKDSMNYTAIKSKAVSLLKSKNININCIQRPKEYQDHGSDAERYINGSNTTDRTLRFQFTIEDSATIQNPYEYVLGLYVDLNADGRYTSSDAETLRGMSVYDSTMGMTVNLNTDTLKSWHTYVVSRDVSELVGVIPWKLEVCRKNGNTVTELSAAIEGFSAIKALNSEKETIRVLQIYIGVGADAMDFGNDCSWGKTVSYLLPTKDDLINAALHKYGSSFDPTSFESVEKMYEWFYANISSSDINAIDVVLYDYNNGANYIKDKVDNAKTDSWKRDTDGNIIWGDVTAIDNINGDNGITVTRKFYDLFKELNEFTVVTDRMACRSFQQWVANGNSVLDKYDMIILGFGDGYGDLNTAACQDINKFISAGKTALFTHDTTSFFNDPSPDASDNTESNVDRYRGGWKWGYNINQFFRSKLALDRYNVTGKIGTYDTDFTVNGTSVTTTNQGYVDNMSNGNQETTKAIRINRGTVTEYPYTIASTITVGTTHNQYYQLNMEDPNIVVWYSLYSDSSDSIYNQNAKDARNYYYIYNVGNVTYSGAGHKLSNADKIIEELKLFVNTVVAAYRASGSPFKTYVTNVDKSSGDKIDYVYVDFDTTDTESALGDLISNVDGKQYKRITYLVEDNSIMDNTGITIKYYIQQEGASGQLMYDEDGEPVWVSINLDTYKMASDNRTFGERVTFSSDGTINNYRVVKDTNYGFDLDLTQLSKRSEMNIKIVTTINFGTEANGDHVAFDTIRYVKLIRRGFFELD